MSLLFNDYYKRFSLGSASYFNVLLKGENTAIHICTYRHGYTSAHALSQAVICSLLSSGLQRSHLDNSPDLSVPPRVTLLCCIHLLCYHTMR